MRWISKSGTCGSSRRSPTRQRHPRGGAAPPDAVRAQPPAPRHRVAADGRRSSCGWARSMVLTPAGERVLGPPRASSTRCSAPKTTSARCAQHGAGTIRVCTQCNTGYSLAAAAARALRARASAGRRPDTARSHGASGRSRARRHARPGDRHRRRARPAAARGPAVQGRAGGDRVAVTPAGEPLVGRAEGPRAGAPDALHDGSRRQLRAEEHPRPGRRDAGSRVERAADRGHRGDGPRGSGVGLLARWSVEPAIGAGRIRALRITRKGVQRQWSAIDLAARPRPPYLTAFLDLLRAQALPTRRAGYWTPSAAARAGAPASLGGRRLASLARSALTPFAPGERYNAAHVDIQPPGIPATRHRHRGAGGDGPSRTCWRASRAPPRWSPAAPPKTWRRTRTSGARSRRRSRSIAPLINLNNGGVCPSPRVVHEAMKRYLDISNQAPVVPHVAGARTEHRDGAPRISPPSSAATRRSSPSRATPARRCRSRSSASTSKPGDEVVTTNQDYGAHARHVAAARAPRRDRRSSRSSFPVPPPTQADLAQRFEGAITPRRRCSTSATSRT